MSRVSCMYRFHADLHCIYKMYRFHAESEVSCNDICGSNFHVIGYISVFWPKGLFYASNFISFICAAMLYVAATLIAFPSFLLGTLQPVRTQSGVPTTSQHGVRAFSSCFQPVLMFNYKSRKEFSYFRLNTTLFQKTHKISAKYHNLYIHIIIYIVHHHHLPN